MLETTKQLLQRILDGISHQPVTVRETVLGTRNFKYECDVSVNDMGLVMGKEGKCIKAIQLIFHAIAKNKRMDRIAVFLHSGSEKDKKLYSGPKTGWDPQAAVTLAEDIMTAFGHPIIHLRTEEISGCLGIIVQPELPEPLLTAVHTVIETYGKSHGQCIGLLFENV